MKSIIFISTLIVLLVFTIIIHGEESMNKTSTGPSTKGAKAEKMCRKYAESVYETVNVGGSSGSDNTVTEKIDNCGILNSELIIGGQDAKPKQFPHMVLIGHRDYPVRWQCGGSLISESWILSAAHCTASQSGSLAKWALLGDLKVNSDDDQDKSSPMVVRIIRRINHPDYDRRKKYNDIALYKLQKPVKFNPFIRPICLQTKTEIEKTKAIATGWGKTQASDDHSYPQTLQQVALDLINDTNLCEEKYKSSANILLKIPQGITADKMLCAWSENKDTCQGDSGGPLQIMMQDPYCMYSIIGITSFGDGCAKSKPGIYTRVSNYVDWIEKHVWP